MDDRNFEHFIFYLNERERIRQKKEANHPKPWTDDPILQNYSFTNILREHDRTSKWFIEHWYNLYQDQPLEIQLLNCGIARYFGTIRFAQEIGFQRSFDPDFIKRKAKNMMAEKQRVFTGAYVITNQGIKAPKEDVVVDIFLSGLWEKSRTLVHTAQSTHSWRATAEELMKIQGFGGTGFMAKEVLQDAMFTAVLPRPSVVDRFTWTPLGPGAIRGLNRIHGLPLNYHFPKKDALENVISLRNKVLEHFEPHMDKIKSRFDLHALQFSLCEIDKYLRVLNEEGRPRKKYPGAK